MALSQGSPRHVSVKRRSCLSRGTGRRSESSGRRMRETGEVMARASRPTTSVAKAERAAGRPIPRRAGRPPVRGATRQAGGRQSGATIVLSSGQDRCDRRARRDARTQPVSTVEHVRKVTEEGAGPTVGRPDTVWRCNLVVNTRGIGVAHRKATSVRESAIVRRAWPCITNASGAAAAVNAIANAGARKSLSLKDTARTDRALRRGGLKVVASEEIGRTPSCEWRGEGSIQVRRRDKCFHDCRRRAGCCPADGASVLQTRRTSHS